MLHFIPKVGWKPGVNAHSACGSSGGLVHSLCDTVTVFIPGRCISPYYTGIFFLHLAWCREFLVATDLFDSIACLCFEETDCLSKTCNELVLVGEIKINRVSGIVVGYREFVSLTRS